MNDRLTEPLDSDVLLRFVNGESPVDERASVERWLAADVRHRAELDRLDRAWRLAARQEQPDFDTKALWERIRLGLGNVPAVRVSRPTPARISAPFLPPSTRSRWARAASAVGAIAAVGLMAVLLQKGEPAPEPVPAPAMRVYTTRPGERAELRLTDGTRAVLNGASTLRIPPAFGTGSRDVYLDGEAYFEVTHDSTNMFRVHTSRMVAEDLGTRFIVTAYASDSTSQVAVAEGVVGVVGKDSAEGVLLNLNDVAHVSSNGVVSATRNVAIDRHLSWLGGVVHFDQDPVSDAARVLGRRFGVEIRVADAALAKRRFTGSVRAATLYEDLRGLALLLDAKYERKGRIVTLSSRTGSAR